MGGEVGELGEVEGGETIIRICYVRKKNSILNKERKKKILSKLAQCRRQAMLAAFSSNPW